MSIPKQVEDNAAMAEELLKQMGAAQNAEEDEAGEQPGQDEVVTEEEGAGEEGAGDQEGAGEEPAATPAEDDEDEETYRERYLTLKGKYDSEVPRLSTELKELKKSVFDKLTGLTDDKAQKGEEKAGAEPEPEAEDPIFARIREEYGDEYLEMLSQLTEAQATKIAKKMIAETVKPVEDKVTSVEEKQLETARDEFAKSLDSKVKNGDWRAAWEGDDPGFAEFLEKEDPSGLYTYADLFKTALDKWDDTKVAKIFDLYLADTGKPAPPSSIPANENKGKEKDALIAPSRTTPRTEPKANDEIIWTKAKIKEFEANDRKGKYSEEESKALWADLLAAPKENRVR